MPILSVENNQIPNLNIRPKASFIVELPLCRVERVVDASAPPEPQTHQTHPHPHENKKVFEKYLAHNVLILYHVHFQFLFLWEMGSVEEMKALEAVVRAVCQSLDDAIKIVEKEKENEGGMGFIASLEMREIVREKTIPRIKRYKVWRANCCEFDWFFSRSYYEMTANMEIDSNEWRPLTCQL